MRAGSRARRARLGNVEYSVVLAVVCVLVLAVAAGLGKAVWTRVQDVNSAWGPDRRQTASANDSGESRGSPALEASAAKVRRPEQYAAVAFWGLAFASLCAAAYLLGSRSRRRRERLAESDRHEASESQILDTEHKLFAKRQDLLRMLHGNFPLLATNGIAVRHLMTSNPLTTPPETPVKELVPLMKDNRVHHVLVCDEASQLLGVISDRDLYGRSGRTARQIMTPNPHVVSPDTALATAISQLVTRQISCLPVVDDGRLCGILTTTDLVLVAQAFLQLWLRLRQEPLAEEAGLLHPAAAIE